MVLLGLSTEQRVEQSKRAQGSSGERKEGMGCLQEHLPNPVQTPSMQDLAAFFKEMGIGRN